MLIISEHNLYYLKFILEYKIKFKNLNLVLIIPN